MKSVLIFGKTIKVISEDLRAKGLEGYFDPQSSSIHMDKTLKGDEKAHTLIHEMIHAVFNRVGLNQSGLNSDLEELICETIATAITENFKLKL